MTAEIGREIEDLARWPGLDLTLPAYRTHHEPESFFPNEPWCLPW